MSNQDYLAIERELYSRLNYLFERNYPAYAGALYYAIQVMSDFKKVDSSNLLHELRLNETATVEYSMEVASNYLDTPCKWRIPDTQEEDVWTSVRQTISGKHKQSTNHRQLKQSNTHRQLLRSLLSTATLIIDLWIKAQRATGYQTQASQIQAQERIPAAQFRTADLVVALVLQAKRVELQEDYRVSPGSLVDYVQRADYACCTLKGEMIKTMQALALSDELDIRSEQLAFLLFHLEGDQPIPAPPKLDSQLKLVNYLGRLEVGAQVASIQRISGVSGLQQFGFFRA